MESYFPPANFAPLVRQPVFLETTLGFSGIVHSTMPCSNSEAIDLMAAPDMLLCPRLAANSLLDFTTPTDKIQRPDINHWPNPAIPTRRESPHDTIS